MPEYWIGISCPRSKRNTVAGPPDADSVVKSSERYGYETHPRGPSTPRYRAPCYADRTAKRFAQDDGFVWGLAIAGWIMGPC
jgi:hypothetical protein